MTDRTAFLDEKSTAARLGVSTSVLRSWRCKSRGVRGPSYVKVGRLVRYPVAALDRWLASRTVNPDAAPETTP